METAGVEPAPPRCKRGALPLELHPLVGRCASCGRMESNHHSARRRVYSAGSSPLLSVRVELGGRPGSNRRRRGSQPRVLPTTPRPPRSGDDRTRTGGLSPDKRALCTSELRPPTLLAIGPRSGPFRGLRAVGNLLPQILGLALTTKCAGGIRTHDLELMRLARTTAPLPRSLAGRSRTCGLRRPKPAGWPLSPTARSEQRAPPAGLEPAASGLRARRHRRFDHRGREAPAAGLEPASHG